MTFNTPEMQALAKQMLAKQQDYSPEADNILPSNRALCSYGAEEVANFLVGATLIFSAADDGRGRAE